MKGRSSHTGQEVKVVEGLTSKWKSDSREIMNKKEHSKRTEGNSCEADASVESRLAWFIVYSLPSGKQLLWSG